MDTNDNSANPTDVDNFLDNAYDFGTVPATRDLNEDQKLAAAFAMAVNAGMVQLVLEGELSTSSQIHLMAHIGDFFARLHRGELIKMPYTEQTLNINSKAASIFFDALISSSVQGSETLAAYKAAVAKYNKKKAEEANSVPTGKYTIN